MPIYQYAPDTLSSNIRFAMGQHTTVAASDAIDTGLTEVYGVVAQLDDDPVAGAMHVTSKKSATAGQINILTWKSTDATALLVAATTFSKKVNWVAFGR